LKEPEGYRVNTPETFSNFKGSKNPQRHFHSLLLDAVNIYCVAENCIYCSEANLVIRTTLRARIT